MDRIRFPNISSRAWEHPADRAALQSLRRVPGFDLAVRKIMSLVSERPLRAITLGSAVEVGPRQFPRVHDLFTEVTEILDAPKRYDLFVTQDPVINAGAIGMENPFIVLNSATVSQLGDDQLRCVLGHELGHILSDHVLYKTMLRVLLNMGTFVFRMPLTGLALYAVLGAMLEWDRKSELSADRASLLCTQDPNAVRATLLHLAGGVGDGASIDAFREQARRYTEDGTALDSIIRTLSLLGRRHPFPVLRLGELDRWVDSGDYSAVLEGSYPVRQDDPEGSAWDDWKASVHSYTDGIKSSADPVAQWVKGAGEGISNAFSWLKRKGGSDADGDSGWTADSDDGGPVDLDSDADGADDAVEIR